MHGTNIEKLIIFDQWIMIFLLVIVLGNQFLQAAKIRREALYGKKKKKKVKK